MVNRVAIPNYSQQIRDSLVELFEQIDAFTREIASRGISDFVQNGWHFVVTILTLYFIFLGFQAYRNQIDTDRAMQIVFMLMMTLSFYAYLDEIIIYLHDIAFQWPNALAGMFISSAPANAAHTIADGVLIGLDGAYDLLVQRNAEGKRVAWYRLDLGKLTVGFALIVVSSLYAVMALALIIINKLRLTILLMLTPLFTLAYIFEKSRSLTQGYIKLVVTSIATLFLYAVFASAMTLLANSAVSDTSFWGGIVSIIMMGLLVYMVYEVQSMAQSIGGAYQGVNPMDRLIRGFLRHGIAR